MPRLWQVVGGAEKGGILVREGQDLKSADLPERLSTGAEIEELELKGDRLHYKLSKGSGPAEGWVSTKISGKTLVSLLPEPCAPDVVGPKSGYLHRWAVDIGSWNPAGDADGAEFQFLLGLIQETADREQVTRYKNYDDKKRALMSRLLIRQASASVLQQTSFAALKVARTKGKKPFLAEPLPHEVEAPNWNVNVSHEGSWVVLASEPQCVVGIDVAELRRIKPNGEAIDFYKSFKENLTETEWADVRRTGGTLDDQYEVFSRYWSAKEAFVKARGDGLAFPLGKAEFQWTALPDSPPKTAYEGTLCVDGKPQPLWRFVQHRLPGTVAHWVTVARAPQTDIIDAHGVFSATLRKKQVAFTPEDWHAALLAPSPECTVLPVAALVPQDEMDAYVAVGGSRWP
uniref:holo-[acyl-carrier-protein] synthase n=1 Tax=Amphidinium carterae TaxID=2961 RepID=A0A977TQI4_AMPCA|nr:phosphopantetheinyl transferase [Amphidinium carterae]